MPTAHGTWHTVSAVWMQAVLTPVVHVASAAHGEHGAFPEMEKFVPTAHATWHTVSDVWVQADFTPVAHVDSNVHAEHGALPVADQEWRFPSADKVHAAMRHSVSDVWVQADFTPTVHVAAAVHVSHGLLPDTEKFVPATHSGHVSAAQSVSRWLQALLSQASAIKRLLHEESE